MVQKVSKASLEDVPELFKLVNSAYRGETSKKGWTTEADLLGGLRVNEVGLEGLIKGPNSFIFKYCDLENEGKIIACVSVEIQDEKIHQGMLTVRPDIQARGLGKELLKAVEEFGAQNSFKLIKMCVIEARKELVEWYERRGFVRNGESTPFACPAKLGIPKVPLNLIFLEKNL